MVLVKLSIAAYNNATSIPPNIFQGVFIQIVLQSILGRLQVRFQILGERVLSQIAGDVFGSWSCFVELSQGLAIRSGFLNVPLFRIPDCKRIQRIVAVVDFAGS